MAGMQSQFSVYKAAGYEALLKYRKEKTGFVPEGEAFITPVFALQVKYIVHAVSPPYICSEVFQKLTRTD